ncbi:MAG: energy transducer TonB, partial [Mucilaginibacter sp.]
MKKILFILIALAFISSAKAQKKDTTNTDQIFLAAEKQPEFEGGLENFYKFVSSHIQYPQESLKNRIEGKVFVAFVVEKDGSLSDVKILRGLTDDINQESIRVVKISPLWIPGMQNGKAVRSQYTVMLKFKLPAIIPTASLA